MANRLKVKRKAIIYDWDHIEASKSDTTRYRQQVLHRFFFLSRRSSSKAVVVYGICQEMTDCVLVKRLCDHRSLGDKNGHMSLVGTLTKAKEIVRVQC